MLPDSRRRLPQFHIVQAEALKETPLKVLSRILAEIGLRNLQGSKELPSQQAVNPTLGDGKLETLADCYSNSTYAEMSKFFAAAELEFIEVVQHLATDGSRESRPEWARGWMHRWDKASRSQ